MNRRTFLAVLAGVASGGCLSKSEPQARLGNVSFVNQTDSARETRLRVERNEAVVFEEQREISVTKNRTVTISEGWPEQSGRFVVTVESEGDRSSIEFTEESCHSLIVEFEANSIGFFHGIDAEDCETK